MSNKEQIHKNSVSQTESHNKPADFVDDNDRIYQGLGHLHRGEHHGDGCFCTTEISGVYRVVLDEVNKLINAHIVSVLEELKADPYWVEDERIQDGNMIPVSVIDATIAAHKQKEEV